MKKKLTAIILVMLLVMSNFSQVMADNDSAEKSSAVSLTKSFVAVPVSGDPVQVGVQDAESYSDAAFQWQICAMQKPVELWVNIYEETEPTLDLTYAMVGSLLDKDEQAYIRCTVTEPDGEPEYSDMLTVGIDETESGTAVLPEDESGNGSSDEPADSGNSEPADIVNSDESSAGTNDEESGTSDIVENTDNDADTDNAGSTDEDNSGDTSASQPEETPDGDTSDESDGGTAADADTTDSSDIVSEPAEEVAESDTETVDTAENTSHTVTAYAAKARVRAFAETSADSDTATDKTVTVTVHHYYQKVDSDEYDKSEVPTTVTMEIGSSLTLDAVEKQGALKGDDGFYAKQFGEIEVNSSLREINIYYDRCYYLLYFDLNGGYSSDYEPVYARFGTKMNYDNWAEPAKAGYTFAGWTLDKSRTDDSVEESLRLNTLPTSICAGNVIYTAQWRVAKSSFTVVYWLQNADDDNYSVIASKTVSSDVETGSEVKDIVKTYLVEPAELENQNITLPTEFTTLKLANYIERDESKTLAMNSGSDSITVKGDGTSVINVCYKRKEYTLRFYYAMSTEKDNKTEYYVIGGSTYFFGYRNALLGDGGSFSNTLDTSKEIELLNQYNNENVYYRYNSGEITAYAHKQRVLVEALTEEKSILNDRAQEMVNNGRYSKGVAKSSVDGANCQYYYIYFKAKYGADLTYLWPCDVFNPVELTTATSYGKYAIASGWNGEYNVWYSQDINSKERQTIKGKYSQLDYKLLWTDKATEKATTIEDDSGVYPYETVSYLCFWENAGFHWSIPKLYRYQIWVNVLDDENAATLPKVTTATEDLRTVDLDGDGKEEKYYLYDLYDTCDDSELKAQTVPAISGLKYKNWSYDEISIKPDGYESAYEVNFYYTRNTYTLTFMNGGNKEEKDVYYNEDISSKYYTPDPPSTLSDSSAYEFGGWYTSPTFADGTKYDFKDKTMPANNLMLYARWVPKERKVTFYKSENVAGSEDKTDIIEGPITISHGSQLSQQTNSNGGYYTIDYLTKLADGTRPADDGESAYNFVAWFYKDAKGNEHAFTADLTVKADLNLYPKWSSEKQVPYTVYYKLSDGTETDSDTDTVTNLSKWENVAEPSISYAQPGTTQTVKAKIDDELSDVYRDNVELTSADTYDMKIQADAEKNTYIFWYTRKTASLTITKAEYKSGDVNQGDTFIFDVKKEDGTLITTVTITGKGSVTVAGLKAGETYTVTEQTNWSWRYTPSGDNGQSKKLSPGDNNSITITNEKDKTSWLSSAAAVVNRWSDNGSKVAQVKSNNGGNA
jgi:uncharacterized repeat protein (TIGR02543 family)